MWRYDYQDKPNGRSLKLHPLEPGKDFKGCEMNETFGWGHTPRKREPLKGIWAFIASIFGIDIKGDSSK
jgi:hypothetical protein